MGYGVYKNKKLKGKYTSENKAFMALQRLQPFSATHAIKYEGWSIRKMPKKRRKK